MLQTNKNVQPEPTFFQSLVPVPYWPVSAPTCTNLQMILDRILTGIIFLYTVHADESSYYKGKIYLIRVSNNWTNFMINLVIEWCMNSVVRAVTRSFFAKSS
jgi:hypothetical protein